MQGLWRATAFWTKRILTRDK